MTKRLKEIFIAISEQSIVDIVVGGIFLMALARLFILDFDGASKAFATAGWIVIIDGTIKMFRD